MAVAPGGRRGPGLAFVPPPNGKGSPMFAPPQDGPGTWPVPPNRADAQKGKEPGRGREGWGPGRGAPAAGGAGAPPR
eukprot:4673400-Prymnesium_polylepis.1